MQSILGYWSEQSALIVHTSNQPKEVCTFGVSFDSSELGLSLWQCYNASTLQMQTEKDADSELGYNHISPRKSLVFLLAFHWWHLQI